MNDAHCIAPQYWLFRFRMSLLHGYSAIEEISECAIARDVNLNYA